MRVIIPAAGLGRRLRPLTQAVPKGLVDVDGAPLLWHLLGALHRLAVDEVIVVCGYRGTQLRGCLTDCPRRPPLVFVDNPGYAQTGSLGSLAAARPWFDGGFCHIDSDLILDPGLIARALRLDHDALAIDATRSYRDIDWKAEVSAGLVTDFSPQLPPHRTHGEFFGLTRWTPAGAAALAAAISELAATGAGRTTEAGYEDAMLLLLGRREVRPLYAGAREWREIDRATDMPAATQLARACRTGPLGGEK